MKLKSKLFILCTMLIGFCASTAAQTWTWTGETPTKGGDFYIYHPNSEIFLNHQNKTGNNLAAGNLDNAFLWTVTNVSVDNDVYTVNLKSGDYSFNLAKGSFNSVNPNLSSNAETIQLSASSTNTSINAYNIHRTANPARYLQYNGNAFSAASSASVQTDWCFITATQVAARENYIATYNKAVTYDVSSDILNANNTANSSNVASKIEALENAIAARLASANLENPINLTSFIVNPNATDDNGWTFVDANYHDASDVDYDGTRFLEVSNW